MKPIKPELRPATRADVEAFLGRPPTHTMRGYVVILDGEAVALGGVEYRHGMLFAFSEIRDSFRPYKVSIYRFARKINEIFGDAPGMALASPSEPGSGKFLTRLGFEHVATCNDGEVYRWAQQQSR